MCQYGFVHTKAADCPPINFHLRWRMGGTQRSQSCSRLEDCYWSCIYTFNYGPGYCAACFCLWYCLSLYTVHTEMWKTLNKLYWFKRSTRVGDICVSEGCVVSRRDVSPGQYYPHLSSDYHCATGRTLRFSVFYLVQLINIFRLNGPAGTTNPTVNYSTGMMLFI